MCVCVCVCVRVCVCVCAHVRVYVHVCEERGKGGSNRLTLGVGSLRMQVRREGAEFGGRGPSGRKESQ